MIEVDSDIELDVEMPDVDTHKRGTAARLTGRKGVGACERVCVTPSADTHTHYHHTLPRKQASDTALLSCRVARGHSAHLPERCDGGWLHRLSDDRYNHVCVVVLV